MGGLGIGRESELINRLYGEETPELLRGIADEISPAIVLGNDRPEWSFLRGEKLCVAPFNVAAVVAATGGVECSLVGVSNMIAVVVVHAECASDMEWAVRRASAEELGTAETRAVRDARWGLTASGALRVQSGTVAFINTIIARGVRSARRPFVYGPHVLVTGASLQVSAVTDNIRVLGTVYWYERGLRPGESA